MLVIAVGFPIVILALMTHFAGDRYTQDEYAMVGGIAILVSTFLLLFFVIPDFRRNALFEYVVDSRRVLCSGPDMDSYDIPLEQIVGLKQVKRQAGQTVFDDYIETSEGESYKIPKRYDLDIHGVKKAIQLAKPGIGKESVVRY